MAKAAGVPRFLFSSSCSLYGAAGDCRGRRDGSVQPGHPVRREQGHGRGGTRALADDDFSPTYLRNATAYGSSPRLRADIVVNNLTGTAFTQGKVRLQSRRQPVAPAGARRGHLPGLRRPARGATGSGPQPGLQRRAGRGRGADPDHRRAGQRHHRRARHLRGGRRSGQPQLPGRLQQDPPAGARLRAAAGRCRKGSRRSGRTCTTAG